MANGVSREELPNGDVRLFDSACTFTFRRIRAGVLLVTISGNDTGQFGTRTLDRSAWKSCGIVLSNCS